MEPSVNDDVQRSEDGAVRSARRRLLRGTFAVPTVMTLQSGSALAATSTLRCFGNMPLGAAPAPLTSPDNVWRIRRYTTKIPGGSEIKVFSGSEIKKIESAMAGKLLPSKFAVDKWYLVSNVLSGQTETSVGTGSGVAPQKDGVLLALRVVSSGDDVVPKFTIVGVALDGYPGGDARIMTGSCWGSVF